MNKRKIYIAPAIRIIRLTTEKNIVQFVVTTHNGGEAKGASDDEEWQVNDMQWDNQ